MKQLYLLLLSLLILLNSCGTYNKLKFEDAKYDRGGMTQAIRHYAEKNTYCVSSTITTFVLHTNNEIIQLSDVKLKPLVRDLGYGLITAKKIEVDTLKKAVYEFMEANPEGKIEGKDLRSSINQIHIYTDTLVIDNEELTIRDVDIVNYEVFYPKKRKASTLWFLILLIPVGLIILAVTGNIFGV